MVTDSINYSDISEFEKAEIALSFLPANDRDVWVNIAFAIKNTFGNDGFTLWDNWSRTANNYNKKAAEEVWKSAKKIGKSIAYLYWLAKKNGFNPKNYQTNTKYDLNINYVDNNKSQTEQYLKAEQTSKLLLVATKIASNDHKYLLRKQISNHNLQAINSKKLSLILGYSPKRKGENLIGDCLIAPVVDTKGKISTLEFIDEEGRKSALYGGKKAGNFHIVNKRINKDLPIVISEGIATGYTIFSKFENVNVICTLSYSNLKNVARGIRNEYPNNQIIIASDIDKKKSDLIEIAKEISAKIVLPSFTEKEINIGNTDFNDMQILGKDIKKNFGLIDQDIRGDSSDLTEHGEKNLHFLFTNRQELIMNLEKDTNVNSNLNEEAIDKNEYEFIEEKKGNEYIRKLADIPQEIREIAKNHFRSNLNINCAREDGIYKGEIYNAEDYLIQCVSNKNVVIHSKEDVKLEGKNMEKLDEMKMLNGRDVVIKYEKDKGKTYWLNRKIDNIYLTCNAFLKSMNELGMGENIKNSLIDVRKHTVERVIQEKKERAMNINKKIEINKQNKNIEQAPSR